MNMQGAAGTPVSCQCLRSVRGTDTGWNLARCIMTRGCM